MVKGKLRVHILVSPLLDFQLLGVFLPPGPSPFQLSAGSGIFEDWLIVSTLNISYFISRPMDENRNIFSCESTRNLCISQRGTS